MKDIYHPVYSVATLMISVLKVRVLYEQFAKLAYDPEACKTVNPRETWLRLERSMPYEGSIYCDVPPWSSSVRVLVG